MLSYNDKPKYDEDPNDKTHHTTLTDFSHVLEECSSVFDFVHRVNLLFHQIQYGLARLFRTAEVNSRTVNLDTLVRIVVLKHINVHIEILALNLVVHIEQISHMTVVRRNLLAEQFLPYEIQHVIKAASRHKPQILVTV